MRRFQILFLSGSASTLDFQEVAAVSIKFIFSWIILLPVGVILSGKLLNARFKPNIGTADEQLPINLPMLKLKATNSEVTLGLLCYMICLLTLGLAFGKSMQEFVKAHYGIDPGQFNALGFMSSLTAAALSGVIYVIGVTWPSRAQIERVAEHDQKIKRITSQNVGKHSDQKAENNDKGGEE